MTQITLISLISILGGLALVLTLAFFYVFYSQRKLQNKEKHLYQKTKRVQRKQKTTSKK